MLVRDVMTCPVVTVHSGMRIKAAAVELTSRGFTALPVVDDGHLVGVVTEADLLRSRVSHDHRSPQLAMEVAAEPQPTTVGAAMTRDVVTTTPLTDVADLVALMIDRRLRSLPVLDGKRMVGIVTRRDVLATFTRADTSVAASVRRALETRGGMDRWNVAVNSGVVRITDRFDDESERSRARVLASGVPGVLGVEVVAADC